MAKDKKSFVLYCDLITVVEKLSNDEAGLLFKHILRYVNDQDPVSPDRITELTFEPIKQSLKRDLEKYESVCDRNRENGKKGGRPKTQKTQSVFTEPKKPDSDNDSVNDIPTWELFKEYGLHKQPNLDINTLKLKYDSWVENSWQITRNGKNTPIKNWKTTLLNTIPFLKTVSLDLPPLDRTVSKCALNGSQDTLNSLLTKGYTIEQIKKAAE